MDSKKLEIIEQAASIFMKYGIKSVTMDDMARELGISKKTLYAHFKDKNDLVVQIITAKTSFDQQKCACAKQEADNAIDEMFRIRTFVSAMMRNIHQSVFYDLKKFHPDAAKILHQHKWSFVKDSILDNIKRGKNEGLYRADLNEEVIAIMYVGATDLLSGGEVFAGLNQTADVLFLEIMKFQLYGMVNEKGRKILEEQLAQIV